MADPPVFEPFRFQPAYAAEVDPEFPGDGDWGVPVFGFDRDGRVIEAMESRWGAPLVVRVTPESAHGWVGTFASGGAGAGGVTGAFACPSTTDLCAVVDGQAYVVGVDRPAHGAVVPHPQVEQVVPVEGVDILLLVFIDIVALGPTGIAWRTPRLCLEGLRVRHADRDGIICSCDNSAAGWGRGEIVLDPTSGVQVAGTRFDSFWPPEALA